MKLSRFGLWICSSDCDRTDDGLVVLVAGFLIPKGWKVMPLFGSIHHSPEFFQDPQTFDPSRFMVTGPVYSYYCCLHRIALT